jgi:hypothetical protein
MDTLQELSTPDEEEYVQPSNQPVKRKADLNISAKRMRLSSSEDEDAGSLSKLYNDYEDSSVDIVEYEMKALERTRDQESRIRGERGAALLESAREERQSSKGLSKLKSLIEKHNYTNDDLIDKLELDDEGIVFAPVVTPKTALTNAMLGPEEDREDCFGCSRGIGVVNVSSSALEDIRQLIIDLVGRTELSRVALLVSEYHRTEIMEPCNRNLRKGELEMRPWTPRAVYDHITKHMQSPDFIVSGMLSDLREHLEILRSTAVYKVRAETARSGRKIHNQDIFVQQRGHRMMMETMNQIQRLLVCNPERMLFYNSNFNIVKDAPRTQLESQC